MSEARHPGAARIRAAMEAGDHAALMAAMATDVVLRSPIVNVPFEGREEAGALFAVLLEVFEEIVYLADFSAGDLHCVRVPHQDPGKVNRGRRSGPLQRPG